MSNKGTKGDPQNSETTAWGRNFVTSKPEKHPSKNDAIQIFQLMKEDFGMSARHFIALSGIHRY